MMTRNHTMNTIKIAAILCFILVDISLIYAHEMPASGYEPSIYASTPAILWISIIVALICGVAIVIYAIYHKLENSKTWLIGLLLILMFYIVSVSIYLIRGYYMWAAGGDASTHILFVRQIIDTGHISSALIYPATHILTVQLFSLTGIGPISLVKLIPIYFSLVYILVFYILARSILTNKGQILLATIAGCIFLSGYPNFTPNYLANCLFPLFIFILIKLLDVKTLNWVVISFIIAFVYPIFHIIPTFTAIIMIAAFLLSAWVYKLLRTGKKIEQYIYSLLLIALLIWSMLWITSFNIWDFTIAKAYNLIAWGGTSYLKDMNTQVTQAQSLGYNVMEYILKQEGNFIVLILITILISPFVWKALRERKSDALLLLYTAIASIGVTTMVLFLLNIGFSPLRLLFYISLICALFVGYALFAFINKARSFRLKPVRYLTMGLAIIVIVALFMNGLSILYPSPYTIQQNLQTTKEEVYGMGQLLQDRNLNADILSTNLAYYRFAHLLLSSEELKVQKIPESLIATKNTPFHFGYDNNTMFAAAYPGDAYLIVTQRDRSVYTDIFPEMAKWRFTADDFNRLPGDESLSKIYASGEFDTYYVYHVLP